MEERALQAGVDLLRYEGMRRKTHRVHDGLRYDPGLLRGAANQCEVIRVESAAARFLRAIVHVDVPWQHLLRLLGAPFLRLPPAACRGLREEKDREVLSLGPEGAATAEHRLADVLISVEGVPPRVLVCGRREKRYVLLRLGNDAMDAPRLNRDAAPLPEEHMADGFLVGPNHTSLAKAVLRIESSQRFRLPQHDRPLVWPRAPQGSRRSPRRLLRRISLHVHALRHGPHDLWLRRLGLWTCRHVHVRHILLLGGRLGSLVW
mmetsp:Transcript_43504/g.120388  ORF Transcript_43504/g.120388 Transcript_43504/m.120388 type:complete len:262 (-) Transcript_43504:199-984(-)